MAKRWDSPARGLVPDAGRRWRLLAVASSRCFSVLTRSEQRSQLRLLSPARLRSRACQRGVPPGHLANRGRRGYLPRSMPPDARGSPRLAQVHVDRPSRSRSGRTAAARATSECARSRATRGTRAPRIPVDGEPAQEVHRVPQHPVPAGDLAIDAPAAQGRVPGRARSRRGRRARPGRHGRGRAPAGPCRPRCGRRRRSAVSAVARVQAEPRGRASVRPVRASPCSFWNASTASWSSRPYTASAPCRA